MQIFLSYTSEMAKYPPVGSFVEVATSAIVRAGHSVKTMQYMTADDASPGDHVTSLLDECDVYVGLIGYRYGSRVPGHEGSRSYVQLEFDVAGRNNLPRLIFLLGDDAPFPRALAEQDTGDHERQEAFRSWLKGGAGLTVAEFANDHSLEVLLQQALNNLRPAPEVGNPPPPQPELIHLPPDIADFTGREDVVAEVSGHLRQAGSGQTPLIISAIGGRAGVGKTALAIHVAHDVGSAFPDGRLYVDLRGFDPEGSLRREPSEVLAGFLRDLGVAGANIPDDTQERSRLYRSRLANKKYLVVLDNAADEAQVRDILPGSPGCAVLITSRRRLGAIAGAKHVDLDVLPSAAAVALLAEIAGSERIAAEGERARELTEYCGRLPLALRIVGARLALRHGEPLEQLCARLHDERDRLRYFRYGDLEVRASFRLSYDELDAGAQTGFRRLGLLRRRSFPLWIFAELLNVTRTRADDVMETLLVARLVDVAGRDVAGQTRYRLHDLLRLFADELVREDPIEENKAAIERVTRGFLALALQADAALQPGGRQLVDHHTERARPPVAATSLYDIGVRDPLAWLTAERRSLVTAVERAAEAGLPRLAWKIAMTVHAFFELRAHWAEWERVAQVSELSAVAAQDGNLLAHARRSLGDLRREQGQFDRAEKHLQVALPSFESAGDLLGRAMTLRSLGNLCRQRFQWDSAYSYFAACHRLFGDLGDERGVALSEHDLGVALRNQGHWEDSIAHFRRCLEVFRKLRDRRSEAYVLRNQAVAYRNQGRWSEATQHIEESLRIFDAIGDQRGWAYALAPLSDVYRETERYDRALDLLDKCLEVRRELGDRRWVAATERSIAVIHRLRGQSVKAEEMLQRCLGEFDDLGDERLAAYTQVGLGEVDGDLGRESGLLRFATALDVLERLDDKLWQAKAHLARGAFGLQRGDRAAAVVDLRAALGTFEQLGAPEAATASRLLRQSVT